MRGQQPVAFLRAQHVGMALERGEAVRDVVVHGGEQRQLAGIARQGCVQVGEHRDAVGDLGRPVRIGRRPLRECHRQPVALVRSGRQLTAVGDHRGADGLEMVGHRDLPGEPGGDIGPHHRGPARDPGHHRRRGQVHLHREPVVQHHRLLDAEPVLTSDGHGRRHRPARTVRPAARPFVGRRSRTLVHEVFGRRGVTGPGGGLEVHGIGHDGSSRSRASTGLSSGPRPATQLIGLQPRRARVESPYRALPRRPGTRSRSHLRRCVPRPRPVGRGLTLRRRPDHGGRFRRHGSRHRGEHDGGRGPPDGRDPGPPRCVDRAAAGRRTGGGRRDRRVDQVAAPRLGHPARAAHRRRRRGRAEPAAQAGARHGGRGRRRRAPGGHRRRGGVHGRRPLHPPLRRARPGAAHPAAGHRAAGGVRGPRAARGGARSRRRRPARRPAHRARCRARRDLHPRRRRPRPAPHSGRGRHQRRRGGEGEGAARCRGGRAGRRHGARPPGEDARRAAGRPVGRRGDGRRRDGQGRRSRPGRRGQRRDGGGRARPRRGRRGRRQGRGRPGRDVHHADDDRGRAPAVLRRAGVRRGRPRPRRADLGGRRNPAPARRRARPRRRCVRRDDRVLAGRHLRVAG